MTKTTGNEQRTQVDNFNFIYYSFSQLLWTPCDWTEKNDTKTNGRVGPEPEVFAREVTKWEI